jgi:predicted DsbA family dithiol-disulfide isomerase
MNADSSSRSFVLYADFNCPFCYALHERLHACKVMGRVEWRGVQHAPQLPIPMARWHGRMLEDLHHEVALVERLAPKLPIAIPEGKPNTKPAIQLAARVLEQDPVQGSELVTHLYRLFWRDGRDISDAALLGEALAERGLDSHCPLEETAATTRILDGWDDRWRGTGEGGVPLLVRSDGSMLAGLAQERELKKFLAAS